MKKILSLLVISVLMCSPVAIAADMQSETRGPMSGSEPIERSDDTGQISKLRSFLSDLANNYRDIPEARNNELKDGSERLLLYPTFNAPEAAFEAAAELYKSSFSDRPDFPAELNVTNWREVQKLVYLDGFDSDINLALLEFFDIYENIDDNVNISRAFDDPRSTGDSLELLLPDVQNVGSVSVRAVPRSYNRRNAVAYANKHATNRNRGYQSFSYDCTNFVSQVLRSGGIRDTGGWYYRKHGKDLSSVVSSRSWRVAHDFVKYWGFSGTSRSIKTITGWAQTGDILALDFANDGGWDHLGAVTAKSSKRYGTAGYLDLRIAQHSSDYNAWISSSTNGWEKSHMKGKYARLNP